MTNKPRFWITKKPLSTNLILWIFVLLFVATETMIIMRLWHPSTMFGVALWTTFGLYEFFALILVYLAWRDI